MEVGILGQFVITMAGRPVEIASRKQRLLLAILLTADGTPVHAGTLTDALWGELPPVSAAANLRQHLYRLRSALGGDRIVRLGGTGVRMRLDDVSVDARRFTELATAGEDALTAGRPDTARDLLGEALGLWRGVPFAELAAEPALTAEVTALTERHLLTLQRRIDADLALGRHSDVVPELTRLVTAHPYQEAFYAQQMLALHRCGRTADALAVLARARRILAGELGLEPGHELRALERSILRQDESLRLPRTAGGKPPGRRRPEPLGKPAELPASVADFTGRTAETALLDTYSGELAVAVVGPAGVGKSALAVHWGHTAADRFPDGQLFVALHGFSTTGPAEPIDALARLLRALGMPADQIPSDVDEAAARYRSMLAGRRMLVVLDDARSASQVRMLLPGRPGSLAVITSRRRLSGLLAHHAVRRIALGPLPTGTAVGLLRRMLTPARIDAEPDASAALVRACGCLPLALRMAAANLTDQPGRSITDYVAELRPGYRLVGLSDVEDEFTLRLMFDSSYAILDATTQLVFRRLSLVAGPDFTAETAAAVAGVPLDDASAGLARLADAHLVVARAPGRYTFHDLVGEYAALRHGSGTREGAGP
ncbi:BTAD domain-containing putative transcriptional regulator [Streptomyces sp. SL13]|uniref:BTAD domain-containing putative transcriptional regulator n=1 Tax=Streptantibioticus silvisoli TaxID=2705255 RepID=A0AA90H3I5_9ACTN|nr:BTAD domain-containing putative transcriptional regulator [Streptantibioticus silvisoli]MDI5963962.1 BTAD domain-containing putative transcriptional regulator [Streptantibioticus silvisoli]MDI5970075.1 BTAD domain-containing putative transcriptional regulator [Streptantibioticus silvisoli]